MVMINVTKVKNHWDWHPCYHVSTIRELDEIQIWMWVNKVEYNLLASGANGYTFQVKENQTFFELVWGDAI
jgi:hypothetical protein